VPFQVISELTFWRQNEWLTTWHPAPWAKVANISEILNYLDKGASLMG
jgi:hypothetical protein